VEENEWKNEQRRKPQVTRVADGVQVLLGAKYRSVRPCIGLEGWGEDEGLKWV